MIYSNVQYWAWVLLYSHSAILLLNKALFKFLKYFFDLFWLLKDIHKNITQIKALIYISFIVPSNLQFLSPWCISMRVWSAWWFSGWLNSFASHFLPIYMQVCVCVCVLCNLCVSTMASNAFPLHRWDNGNARVNSVPQVDCYWISLVSGANLRSGKLQPSCLSFVWLYYIHSVLLC